MNLLEDAIKYEFTSNSKFDLRFRSIGLKGILNELVNNKIDNKWVNEFISDMSFKIYKDQELTKKQVGVIKREWNKYETKTKNKTDIRSNR